MKHLVWLAALPGLAVGASAQSADSQQDRFCNDGIIADGYIDFNDLPPAPTYPFGGPPTAPVTATLPVHGIPGLQVQVQIPAITNSNGQATAYQVQAGAVTFAGAGSAGAGPGGSSSGGSTPDLGFKFSGPVQGVAVNINQPGRSGFDFFLSPDPEGSSLPRFQQSVTANTESFGSYGLGLQAVDRGGSFTTTYIALPFNGEGGGVTLSNFRVQSLKAEAALKATLPKQGLSLWLQSETIDAPRSGIGTANWPDSSGNGRDAAPSTAGVPALFADGRACRPSYVFGNAASYLKFNLPINGWRTMTVFLVASAGADQTFGASQNSALFWEENQQWGNTFVSPYPAYETFRFGTGQVGNQPLYQRPVDLGADYTITRAVHNNDTDALYVDGRLALKQGGKQPVLNGTTGEALIGQGLNGTAFPGRISEILVYNRVLTDDESATVEQYLRDKFRTN